MNWRDEVLNTARIISETTDRHLYVCHSGGIDGEVVCLALRELNIDFTVVTFRHITGTNVHDVRYAEKFCNTNKLKHKIIPLDLNYFYKTYTVDKINNGYKSFNMFMYFQIYAMELIESWNGCAIIAGGEQIYCTKNNEVHLHLDGPVFVPVQWCEDYNLNHHPLFYLHNSELFASYMQLDLIKLLISDPEYYINSFVNVSYEKIMIYHKYWKNMIRRPKYTGYEYIPQNLNNWWRDNYETELLKIHPDHYIPISKIKKDLGID
jgi:hypothetical protein